MSIKDNDREVISTAVEWLDSGHTIDLVTVVKTWGSSPRPAGSMAVVRDDGVLAGSVSGGCVEKQLAESFRQNNRESVITHHIDDAHAQRFGLSCGGQLELVFESINSPSELKPLLEALETRRRICRVVNTENGKSHLEEVSANESFSFDGHIVRKVFGPEWRVLLIGAGQLSRYTAEFAMVLDFEVLVCDPRPEFRAAWSVEGARVLEDSPDEAVLQHATDARSAVLALTHDPNLDDMALMEALPSKAFYIGALGSRKNYANRKKRLSAIGLSDDEIGKLIGPIGLDIGSRTSAEIAISIVAHLIKTRANL